MVIKQRSFPGLKVAVSSSPAGLRLPSESSLRGIADASRQLLRAAGVRRAEISVVCLSGTKMRQLNRKHLGHDYVTDVVTFDLSVGAVHEPPVLCGEIYICSTEAVRNAKLYGESVGREILRYVAHGILHLLGSDDETPAQRERMRRQEDELLTALVK
jgi:probable rRNA maturation factor